MPNAMFCPSGRGPEEVGWVMAKKHEFEITVKADISNYTVKAKNEKEARKKIGKMVAKHFVRVSLSEK
jgi:hypothetical protein